MHTILAAGCDPEPALAFYRERVQTTAARSRDAAARLYREANSRCRLVARASNRFATLAHAISSTMAAAPIRIHSSMPVSPTSAWAHYTKGQVLRVQLQYEDAAIEYETAITLDRNLVNAYGWLGRCKLLTGSVDEVIPVSEYAIRLSPHDRNVGFWYWQIGPVHLLKARIDEAVPWLEKARSAYPGSHFIHASLAAGYALKDETKRASVALGEARRLSDRYASMTHLKAAPGGQWFEALKLRTFVEATYFAGLRKAGMPEE